MVARLGADLSARASARIAESVARVEAEAASAHRGTRKRAIVPFVGGLAAIAGLFGLVSNSVLAVGFTTADNAFQVYTDKVYGVNGAGFLDLQNTMAGQVGVAEIGFGQAKLYGLCAIATQDLGTLGPYSLVIRAGEKVDGVLDSTNPTPLSATNLYLSSAQLTGTGDNIKSMHLGRDAKSVTTGSAWPAGMTPVQGAFGLQAQELTISKLNASTRGIDLNDSISLPNLRIQVVKNARTYADCANDNLQ